MKRIITTAFALAAMATMNGYGYDAILDQEQSNHSRSIGVFAKFSAAQTFTAGMTGFLDHIEMAFDNDRNNQYPTTISIVKTSNGVPNGPVLGSVDVSGFDGGWNSINFSEEEIILFATVRYGIVLSNDDPDILREPTVWWNIQSGGGHPGGAGWTRGELDSWKRKYLYDGTFKTYMRTDIPVIGILPSKLDFVCALRGANPEPQTVPVGNGSGRLHLQITEDCNWVEVCPVSHQPSGEVDEVIVTVDKSGLGSGLHSCVLTFSDPNAVNSPQYITVNLDIRRPVIGISPGTLNFVCALGGVNPEPQILSIWNADIGTLDWEITSDCNWLSMEPDNGSSTGEVDEVGLAADVSGFALGSYNCMLSITGTDTKNTPQMVPVSLHVLGDIVHVPGDFATIQEAINHTIEGGTVIVGPGTYTGSGNYRIDYGGRAITVRSTEPSAPDVVAATVIDCNNIGRGFYFHSGEDANSVLSGFTITNGRGYYGDSRKRGYAGGIDCYESSPVISNCIITFNSGGAGGGIDCFDSSPVISDCVIAGNSGRVGGGIFILGGRPAIRNCVVAGNIANYDGGGISFDSAGWGALTIDNSVIIGNKAAGLGGALYCEDSDVAMNGCTISGNAAGYSGGGIYSRDYGHFVISNSILWDNSAPEGPEIALDGRRQYSTVSVSYCDVKGEQDGVYVEEGCTLDWGIGNRNIDPCFFEPGYWGHIEDLGMQVEPNDANAVWVDGDYHLKSEQGRWDPTSRSWVQDSVTSPCIDAGEPNLDWTAELWPNGRRINLGAYGGTGEASMSPNDVGNIADLDLDGFVYRTDIPFFVEQWLAERFFLHADMTRDGIVDFPDFAVFAQNWERPPLPCPATGPSPGNKVTNVISTPILSWTSCCYAVWHDVYLGTDSAGVFQSRQKATMFEPGYLAGNTWYYWRIDEVNPGGKTTGTTWSFETGTYPAPANTPDPYNGAVGIGTSVVLSWEAGSGATSHDVYFGTSSPGAFQGNQTETTFRPDRLYYETTYYWRIDEVNNDGTTTGAVWSFTTTSGGTTR